MSMACEDNFKVAVRLRPQLPREIASGSIQCVEIDSLLNNVIVTKPDIRRRLASRIGIDDFGDWIRSDSSQKKSFTFDIVFNESSTQDLIFKSCACDIVKSVIDGYNGSIIASGQTSSGKTYTIEGTKECPGILPRAAEQIFSQIGSSSSGSDQYLVRTSYLQIYNERISDLLDPSRENLKIREDGVGGIFVDSLSDHVVRNTAEVMEVIHNGQRLRTTSTTRMNKESSRSHAVFTIIVEHAQHDKHSGSIVTVGKLRLVDLAGSERIDVESDSKIQEETKNINVSLHNFSKVVTALTTPSMKHVPYRDSKLTRILQDCLGGNCKTILIATVTPVGECYCETMNTLTFAKRAKNIKNTAQINQDVSDKALISSYQSEIKKLRLQLEERGTGKTTDYIQLEREHKQAQMEKEEVRSKLEAQQRLAEEAQAEKQSLMSRIQELENMFLHGGSRKVVDSDEFKEAMQKEQQRLKKETEMQYEHRLAALEEEKRRLEREKLSIEEKFTRLHCKGVSSCNKGNQETEQEESAESLCMNDGSATCEHTPSNCINDPESVSALHEYMAALCHPLTGIPCQELGSGIQIFTGSSAVHWFIKNMEGVSSMQKAQVVGQRLIDLGVFIEIQGGTRFAVSSTVYYQFCGTSHPRMLPEYHTKKWVQSRRSISHSSKQLQSSAYSGLSSQTRSVSSSSVFSSSVASLNISDDLIDHFGLTSSCPTEIHTHCLYGDREKVKPLLSRMTINSTDTHGRTPLMYSAIGKRLKCCVMLVRYGAEINLKDHSGYSALLYAAKYEYEDIMKILLKSGAETHLTDSDGRTVFHLASISHNYKCLEYLFRYGATGGINARDNSYKTPLLLAVRSKLPGHVKRLLMAKADLGVSDNQGRTALHYTVTCNSLPCAQAIVETNPNDINLIDTAGMSALHLACMNGSSDMVHYLSSFSSCDINLQDEKGSTALHFAVIANQPDLIHVLLSKGASVVVKDNLKKTPLQYSLEMGLDECSRVLKAAK